MTHTLLKLSVFDKSIFWHDVESYIILEIIGVLLGLLVGRFAWSKYRVQAKNLELSNQKLNEIHRLLYDQENQIGSVMEEL